MENKIKISDKMYDGIINHICTSKVRNFPRRLGFPKQIPIYRKTEIRPLINEHIQYRSCYSSVYSDWQIENSMYDKVYIDIDCETNLSYAHREMQEITDYSLDYFDYEPRINFTANKGFAIYFDYPETELEYSKNLHFAMHIEQILKLNYLDIAVTKDRRRISRLPYTKNFNAIKRNLPHVLCVPVNPRWSLHRIIEESKMCKFTQDIVIDPSNIILKTIKNVDIQQIETEIEYNNKEMNNIITDEISNLMDNAGIIEDGRHRILCHIFIPHLIGIGKTNEEVHMICKLFIEKSGKSYHGYKGFVNYHISRNRDRKFRTWTIEELLVEYPDVYKSLGSE